MRKLKYIIILLGILTFSCKDPRGSEIFIEMEDLPAASYLKAEADKSGEYSLWVEMLEYSETFKSLNLAENYTCFVPTNEAITAYLKENNLKSVTDIDKNYAKLIVKYHNIPGSMRMQSSFSDGILSDTTASGDNLSIAYLSSSDGLNIQVNGYSRIEKMDIEVTNGVIHTINKLLVPVTATVWDEINKPVSQIFADAVAATGKDEVLKKINQTDIINGRPVNRRFKYTVFEVQDQVYRAAGITNLSQLAAHLGAASDYTSTDNKLNQYVAYHILDGVVSTTEMNDFGKDLSGNDLDQKNYVTQYPDGLINCRGVGANLYINYDAASGKISLTTPNISMKNGVVHVVDGVMPVEIPKPIVYKFELTDYADVANMFSDVYRIKMRVTNFQEYIPLGSVTCYNWKSTASTGDDKAVMYYMGNYSTDISSANGGTNIANATYGQADILNGDVLNLTLGEWGWIEMTIPPVVKGKYKISIQAYRGSKIAATDTKKGKLTFMFDDDPTPVGTAIIATTDDITGAKTGINPNYKAIAVTQDGTPVEFSTTKSHKLKILSSDGATTQLDYLIFEPVE